MGDILDASGHKMATIAEDGKVRNLEGAILGYILEDGHIDNHQGVRVGYFDSEGHVYRGVTRIGAVHADGKVYDIENHYAGKVAGDHIESGGAALLLLIR